MANPRKFSEKIALHNQKQAEETAAFEKIMREVSDATNKPEEVTLATQYVMSGARSGGTSPARSPGQRGRASSSVGPIRRPSDRKHDTSPYGSTIYLSPPQTDSSWRRSNSDSALHQSFNEQPPSPSLSPHHPLHSHAHPHHAAHHHHRRATTDIHLDALTTLGVTQNNRPRSSCEMPRVPNNTNYSYSAYDAGGGGGGGGLTCGELQVPGGSLPDLTSVHFPPSHTQPAHAQRNMPPQHHHSRAASPSYTHHSPTSPGAISPGGGSISPATGGLSPASGSPVGATVPALGGLDAIHAALRQENQGLYENQNNMSPIEHAWITSSYQSHCSPPSQYSSTSNINIPSPTMVHSPGSPAESPQTTDYSNLHQALLQPFEQITMLDGPPTSYSANYINHSSPVQAQASSPHTYTSDYSQECDFTHRTGLNGRGMERTRAERDPVPGGAPAFPRLTPPAPATPGSIPDIILTDYSGELEVEAGMFGGEEAQLRAGLDLDELTLLEEPGALLPDSAVEHEFRQDLL